MFQSFKLTHILDAKDIMIQARALHYVLKIGDRGANANFFRNILGMKVLRHEEFKEGCEAQCNGPYDNRWSKTMVGYGPEKTHFAIELTYNYGIRSYALGNDLHGITIHSNGIIDRAKQQNYPFTVENDVYALKSPDGYTFFIIDAAEPHGLDPVRKVTLNTNDMAKTQSYWINLLQMRQQLKTDSELTLTYDVEQTHLVFRQIETAIDRKEAYGRIAFAVPYDAQTKINKRIFDEKQVILTPLVSLATPGKATVRVIILADPNKLEICFVDEEGFSQLSQVDPDADVELTRNIERDPNQIK